MRARKSAALSARTRAPPKKKRPGSRFFLLQGRNYFPVAVLEEPPLPAEPVLDAPPAPPLVEPAPAPAPPAALGESPEDLARLAFLLFLDFLAFFGAASVVASVAEEPEDAAGDAVEPLVPPVLPVAPGVADEPEVAPVEPPPVVPLPVAPLPVVPLLPEVPPVADEPVLPPVEPLPEPDEPEAPVLPEDPDEVSEAPDPDVPPLPDAPEEPEAPEPDEPEPDEPDAPDVLGDAEVPVEAGLPVSAPEAAAGELVALDGVPPGEVVLLPDWASAMDDTDATTINDSERSVVFNVIRNSFNWKKSITDAAAWMQRLHACSAQSAPVFDEKP